jgi:hypothetical protein
MVAILDSLAVALAASDGGAASPSSIAELAAFSTRTMAQALGGAAVVWLLDDSGDLDVAASADQDPARDALLARALGGARRLDRLGLVGGVLSSGAPVEAREVRWTELGEWDNLEAAQLLDELGPVALCIVPVRARTEIRGALLLARQASKAPLRRPSAP